MSSSRRSAVGDQERGLPCHEALVGGGRAGRGVDQGPGAFPDDSGGYFHGMVAKAKTRELNLERTLWAMRRTEGALSRSAAGGEATDSRGLSALSFHTVAGCGGSNPAG